MVTSHIYIFFDPILYHKCFVWVALSEWVSNHCDVLRSTLYLFWCKVTMHVLQNSTCKQSRISIENLNWFWSLIQFHESWVSVTILIPRGAKSGFVIPKKMNGLQGNLIILGPYPHAMSTPQIMRFPIHFFGTMNFRFKHFRFKKVFQFKEEFHCSQNFST